VAWQPASALRITNRAVWRAHRSMNTQSPH